MKENTQTIRCSIDSCAHCRPDHYCELNEIKVRPCAPCGSENVETREDSMCASFEERMRSMF